MIMNCQPQGRQDDLEVWSSSKHYQSLPSSSTPSLISHKGKGSASSTGGGGRRRFPTGFSSCSSLRRSSSQPKKGSFDLMNVGTEGLLLLAASSREQFDLSPCATVPTLPLLPPSGVWWGSGWLLVWVCVSWVHLCLVYLLSTNL